MIKLDSQRIQWLQLSPVVTVCLQPQPGEYWDGDEAVVLPDPDTFGLEIVGPLAWLGVDSNPANRGLDPDQSA